jgi:hypothetical protein
VAALASGAEAPCASSGRSCGGGVELSMVSEMRRNFAGPARVGAQSSGCGQSSLS